MIVAIEHLNVEISLVIEVNYVGLWDPPSTGPNCEVAIGSDPEFNFESGGMLHTQKLFVFGCSKITCPFFYFYDISVCVPFVLPFSSCRNVTFTYCTNVDIISLFYAIFFSSYINACWFLRCVASRNFDKEFRKFLSLPDLLKNGTTYFDIRFKGCCDLVFV